MEYDISSTNGWIETTPQTGESTWNQVKKAIVLLSFSSSSGVCLPVVAYEQTGYETPISTLDADYTLTQFAERDLVRHSFNAEDTTDRLKRVFGLSISKQAQIFGVSRQAVYNWRNGEEPTGKNLESLMDLNNAAELFETEGIQVTGLLMKRPFIQGKSLLDLMEAKASIYQPAQKLVNQIKREAEEKSRLAQRFGHRQQPKIDYGLDLE